MQIDCERCPNRVGDIPCADCLVEFVLALEDESVVVGPEAPRDIVLSAAEARAVRALSDAGLVPPVRLVPRRQAG